MFNSMNILIQKKMRINNNIRARKLSKIITGIIIIYLTALTTFAYLEISVGILIIMIASVIDIILLRLIDLQYVEISDENGLIELKYYPLEPFRKKKYSAIRFSAERLRKVEMKYQLKGITAQMIITVQSDSGLATYPSISMSAVKESDRNAIMDYLDHIVMNNREMFN